MMRPSLHSHSIENEVPTYGSLTTTVGSTAPPYAGSSSTHNDVTELDARFDSYDSIHEGHDAAAAAPSSTERNEALNLESVSMPLHISSNRRIAASTPPYVPNTASPGQFDMLPPPHGTHPTWQALHDYAQSHASAHGYALSINTTAKNRSRIKLACVCYGAPKNTHKLTPETRVRKNRASYKTGCKMWVEGKRQADGVWALIVGEPTHNHPGRSAEGWAVQRKRTWGVQGGRVGVGGVTAKEEKARMGSVQHSNTSVEDGTPQNEEVSTGARKSSHSLESGGLVWKIVEQEMLRKGGTGQGRDRGVGRTVQVLEERLPGIHIFKRDVYNIRAQIKRARKMAGQELGEGLNDDEEEGDQEREEQPPDPSRLEAQLAETATARTLAEIDPQLVAQCNDALRNVTPQEESEVDRLRRENNELRQAVEEKNSQIESLKVQVDMAHMALYNDRRNHAQN